MLTVTTVDYTFCDTWLTCSVSEIIKEESWFCLSLLFWKLVSFCLVLIRMGFSLWLFFSSLGSRNWRSKTVICSGDSRFRRNSSTFRRSCNGFGCSSPIPDADYGISVPSRSCGRICDDPRLLFGKHLFPSRFSLFSRIFSTFQHVADPVMASARWSPVTMFSCALGLAYMWYRWAYFKFYVNFSSSQNKAEHAITSGVLVTVVSFILGKILLNSSFLACVSLTSSATKHRGGGVYVGISDTGMPLFTYGESFLKKTSRSLLTFCKVSFHPTNLSFCPGNTQRRSRQ